MIKNYIRYKTRHNFLFRKYINQIKGYYELTSEQLDRKKNDLFIKHFKRSINHSVFYKELYSKYGICEDNIKTLDDITKLPIITKNDIKDRIDDLLIGKKIGITRGYTSGTSGSPLTVYRSFKSVLVENAYIWNHRTNFGLNPRDAKISIRGDLNKDELFRMDKSANTLFISSYNLNEKNLSRISDMIQSFKPKALLGYPSSLYILANEFDKKELEINIPLSFTSSESLYDFQKLKIEKIFTSKIYDWYGNSERTIAFEQCDFGNYHEVPLYSINEYNEDHIITTSLINNIFPLIRYKIEDIIIPVSKKCQCGSSLTTTEKIGGRSDDIIVLKDNTYVGSPGISTSFKEIEGILYTQLIQNSLDQIDVRLVIKSTFSNNSEKKLISNLKDRLGSEMKFNVKYIEESELLKSRKNKYKLIINNYLKEKNSRQ